MPEKADRHTRQLQARLSWGQQRLCEGALHRVSSEDREDPACRDGQSDSGTLWDTFLWAACWRRVHATKRGRRDVRDTVRDRLRASMSCEQGL